MAKKSGKLARRYARALLQAVARELGGLETSKPTPAQKIAGELKAFSKLWRSEPRLSSSLLNPMFERGERLQALNKISELSGLSKMSQRFLQVVFERERIAYIVEIIETFAELADAEAGLVKVQLQVAKSIDESEKRTIEESLIQQIGSSASFSWQVEPDLLGGMIVRYGGKIVDGSLRGRLERIERTLMG